MIERLVLTFQALAAPADVQLEREPDVAARVDALAGDYADAMRLVIDCPQVQLAPAQRDALERLEAHLDRVSGAAPRTEAALHAAPESHRTRELARQALAALGLPAA